MQRDKKTDGKVLERIGILLVECQRFLREAAKKVTFLVAWPLKNRTVFDALKKSKKLINNS